MIHLAVKRLIRRKFVSIVLIIALLCIFVMIPFGLQSVRNASLAVENSIEEHGRGSYDILVRPNSSRTPIEKDLGMVEENYIGDSKGGISIEDWKDIQQDPEIEIAAPVASLGYFTGKNLSIELPELKESAEFTWEFYTSDGLKEYSLGQPRNLVYFKESTPGNVQFLRDLTNAGESAASSSMEVMMPPAYYILAAIDVESEEKLTRMDLSDLNKDFEIQDREHLQSIYGDIPVIKVIQREDVNVPIKLKLSVETLDLDFNEYSQKLEVSSDDWIMQAEETKKKEILEELAEKEPISSREYEFDLTPFQKPYDGTALRIDERFQLTDPIYKVISRIHNMQYFTAEKLNYQSDNGGLTVGMIKDGEPPSYKELKTHGHTLLETHEFPYIMEQIGTFSADLTNQNQLTSSPLGIYSTSDVTTEDGKLLMPTTVPGSFIAQPAGGLVSIESAELIKGPKPIDAIRVRVANVTSYNEEAIEKIERVATGILQKGYEVDIVAGSSFKMVQLNVDGIGIVESPWTTLGVAQILGESWNYMAIVSSILFLSFAVIWLVTRLVFERNMLEQENQLLTIIGWQEKKITLRNRIEQFILLFSAYLLSIPVIEILSLERSAYIVTTIILILGSLLIYLILRRVPVPMRKQEVAAQKQMPAIKYYWSIIFPIMIILVISTVLLSIQLASIVKIFISSRETFLGQFTVDETLWFQLSIVVATIILAIIGLSESIQALLHARRQEFSMYKIIGWTRKRILNHILREVIGWGGLALLTGLAISLLVQSRLGIPFVWSFFSNVFSTLLLGLLVCIFLITNRTLSDSAGDKGIKRRLTTKLTFKYIGVIGLALTILFIGTFHYATSGDKGNMFSENLIQTANIKSGEEPTSKPVKQLSATSGAEAQYKIDLKLDESDTFHISAEIDVQNVSDESWKDIGFYFIPNALTEENKPGYMEYAAQFQMKTISNGEEIPYELHNNELLLKFEEEVAPGETKQIKIEYSLLLPENGFRLKKQNGSYHLAQWYPMLGFYDGGWNIHDFNPDGESYHTDYGYFEVTYNLPEDFLIASSGVEGSVIPTSSGKIIAEQVKDFYLAILNPDEWISETTKSNDTSIRIFLPVNESKHMDETLKVSSNSFRFFEEKLGDNPFMELDVIGNNGQMEYPNVVEVSLGMEHVIVHEIAHQWFYNLVQNDPFNEGWLDEGLTNFVTSIYLTEKYGNAEIGYDHPTRMAERQSPNKIANLPLDQFEEGEYISTVYGKVPLLLRDFFEKNGGMDEAIQFLSQFIDKYKFNNVSSKTFMEYFNDYFEGEHEEFITEWLKV